MWLALDTNVAVMLAYMWARVYERSCGLLPFRFSPNAVGNSLGILYHFIDGTTTAGLLTWICQFTSPKTMGKQPLTNFVLARNALERA
jgi:hypothetical protein